MVNAITNDLNMYMWGSGLGKGEIDGHPVDTDASRKPVSLSPKDQAPSYGRSRAQFADEIKSLRVQQGRERKRGKGREDIDCGEFKRDLKDVQKPTLAPIESYTD